MSESTELGKKVIVQRWKVKGTVGQGEPRPWTMISSLILLTSICYNNKSLPSTVPRSLVFTVLFDLQIVKPRWRCKKDNFVQ